MRDVFRISIPEFTFGGGLLLVVLGISNIMAHTRRMMHRASDKHPEEDAEREINLAVSPIAFPLLVGPGSIVTVMLIVDHHGSLYGVAAGAVAFVFVMAVLHWSDRLLGIMGKLGTVAIGRVLQIFHRGHGDSLHLQRVEAGLSGARAVAAKTQGRVFLRMARSVRRFLSHGMIRMKACGCAR